MCGRYAIIDGKKVLASFPMLQQAVVEEGVFSGLPQYNAAPMQKLPVVAVRGGALTVQRMQWSLVPHWSKEPKSEFSTFNAKGENLEKSRLFASYFKGRRCLVPADAFYEWKKETMVKVVGGKPKEAVEKHPMCIRMKDEGPFMFAGLFSVWRAKEGQEEFPTFTIITTEPNELLAPIHNRMPVILGREHFDQWLDREYHDTDSLRKLIAGYPASKMKAYRVSRVVSSSQNNVPECMDPLPEGS
jgi:putative SOS response-associated peptidase YedK